MIEESRWECANWKIDVTNTNMLKDLSFLCNIFPLFTLKCVSYEFLSLSSRKFNVAERLIFSM